MAVTIKTTTRSSITCDSCGRSGPWFTSDDRSEVRVAARNLGWSVVDDEDRCPNCPDTRRAVACSEFLCENRRNADAPRPDSWVVIRIGEQEREREYCSWSCVKEMIYCATRAGCVQVMATYEKQKKGVHNGLMDWVEITACEICGAEVFDTEKHDEFHDRIDRIGATARAADDTAQMFRPIGGGPRKPLPKIDVDGFFEGT